MAVPAWATIPTRMPSITLTVFNEELTFEGDASLINGRLHGDEMPFGGAYWRSGTNDYTHYVRLHTGGAAYGHASFIDTVHDTGVVPEQAVLHFHVLPTDSAAELDVTLTLPSAEFTENFTVAQAPGGYQKFAVPIDADPTLFMDPAGFTMRVDCVTGSYTRVGLLSVELMFPEGSALASEWMSIPDVSANDLEGTGSEGVRGYAEWSRFLQDINPGTPSNVPPLFQDPGTPLKTTGDNNRDCNTWRILVSAGVNKWDDRQSYRVTSIAYTGDGVLLANPSYFDLDPAVAAMRVESQGYEWQDANDHGVVDNDVLTSYKGSVGHARVEQLPPSQLPSVKGTAEKVRVSWAAGGWTRWNGTSIDPEVSSLPEFQVFSLPNPEKQHVTPYAPVYFLPSDQIVQTGTPLTAPKPFGEAESVEIDGSLVMMGGEGAGFPGVVVAAKDGWIDGPGMIQPDTGGAMPNNFNVEAALTGVTGRFYMRWDSPKFRFLYTGGTGGLSLPYWDGQLGDWVPGYGYPPGQTEFPVFYPDIVDDRVVIVNPQDPTDPWVWGDLPPGADPNGFLAWWFDNGYFRVSYNGIMVLAWLIPPELYAQLVAGGAVTGYYNTQSKVWQTEPPPVGEQPSQWQPFPWTGSYVVNTLRWESETGDNLTEHGVRWRGFDILLFGDRAEGGELFQDKYILSAQRAYLFGRKAPPFIVGSDEAAQIYEAGFGWALYPEEA